MLPFRESGPANATPILLLLHFFGGSHREWDGVLSRLAPTHRAIAADLAGFGEAVGLEGFSVQAMVDRIEELVRYFAPASVVLVAHSMPGKPAMVLAATPPPNLIGLVLCAPSPLSGEPMTEEQRATMAIANTTRDRAETFTKGGFHHTPPDDIFEKAVEDVLRADDEAFHAWPEHGSRENWSDRVDRLQVPALLIVGEHDKAIAPDLQRKETLPLVEATGGKLHLLKDAAHLTPYECPDEIADVLKAFCKGLHKTGSAMRTLP